MEVVELTDYLLYFYWGRFPEAENMDMQLGGGSYVIHKGEEAIVFDTMHFTEQGEWVKDYLEDMGIKHFTVVNSHWHLDHIASNYLYEGSPIIGHHDTRDVILANKDAIEAGTLWGPPAMPAVPPNVTFDERMDLWLGDLKVELHHFNIHSDGHIAAYIPQDKILLAADMVEDPIFIIKFYPAMKATPGDVLSELERMKAMDIEHIYPIHGYLKTIKAGGYDKRIIDNMMHYTIGMIARVDDPDFFEIPAQEYIAGALERGELYWWEPYTAVHRVSNQPMVYDYFHPGK